MNIGLDNLITTNLVSKKKKTNKLSGDIELIKLFVLFSGEFTVFLPLYFNLKSFIHGNTAWGEKDSSHAILYNVSCFIFFFFLLAFRISYVHFKYIQPHMLSRWHLAVLLPHPFLFTLHISRQMFFWGRHKNCQKSLWFFFLFFIF